MWGSKIKTDGGEALRRFLILKVESPIHSLMSDFDRG